MDHTVYKGDGHLFHTPDPLLPTRMDTGLYSAPMWLYWRRETSTRQIRLVGQTSEPVGSCTDSAILPDQKTRGGTNEPTPRSKVLLEKLRVHQLVKKFPTFNGTQTLITIFTTVHYLSLSQVRLI
jgi:hypothetical protein